MGQGPQGGRPGRGPTPGQSHPTMLTRTLEDRASPGPQALLLQGDPRPPRLRAIPSLLFLNFRLSFLLSCLCSQRPRPACPSPGDPSPSQHSWPCDQPLDVRWPDPHLPHGWVGTGALRRREGSRPWGTGASAAALWLTLSRPASPQRAWLQPPALPTQLASHSEGLCPGRFNHRAHSPWLSLHVA